MMDSWPIVAELPAALRIVVILGLAALAHFVVRALRRLGEWVLAPARTPRVARHELLARSYPKVASVTSLIVSALTFLIYFVALGLVLQEFRISLTAYLATASVVGLAVAFGMQGLVQDVVIGLTLIFTDAFDVGDVVEISGQIGRVEQIGLRFTTLVNLHGQRVYVPNRNIAMVGRFRAGVIRAYVDVQLPEGLDESAVRETVERVARGMRAQHPAILVTDPEISGPETADPGGWRYLRVRFRLWPGQGALIETAFRQRLLAALRALDPSYPDWMVTVTYLAR
jgi:small conductance mechanosensitive channel